MKGNGDSCGSCDGQDGIRLWPASDELADPGHCGDIHGCDEDRQDSVRNRPGNDDVDVVQPVLTYRYSVRSQEDRARDEDDDHHQIPVRIDDKADRDGG